MAGEHVVIRNTGECEIDLGGFVLADSASHPHRFKFPPTFKLAPGAEVKVWTGKGQNDSGNLYWGRAKAVWNNEGDIAILKDSQGNEIERFIYTPKHKFNKP